MQGMGGCCGGGIYTEVYDPSKQPPEHPNLTAARDARNSSLNEPLDIEEKDDDSFDNHSVDAKKAKGEEATVALHPSARGQAVKKMDSLIYTDSDSDNDNTRTDENAPAVRQGNKKPAGGKALPGMDKNHGAELTEAYGRSIGGRSVPRTLPSHNRRESEDDVFEDMDDM